LKGNPKSFAEIGKQFKLSSSGVQQSEYVAIKQIRKSDVGKELMQKYKWMMINFLEDEKDGISLFSSPEKIVDRMQTIDELLYGILKKCC